MLKFIIMLKVPTQSNKMCNKNIIMEKLLHYI